MARKIEVEILGDSRSLERAFSRSETSAKRFERTVESAGRGALAGTGHFNELGRSLAYAGTAYLGFAGAFEAVTKSVEAAREAAVSQKQLQAQLRTSGVDWETVATRVEDADLALSKLSGFTADQLEQSFTTLVRATGNVNEALRLNRVAADVARGRHISLAQASLALGKAAAGSTTALRRLGIQLPKGASGMEAIRVAAQRFSGQAAAGATASDKFQAALHNTEVTIGTQLLPTLDKYLQKSADWLNQTQNQKTIADDAATAMHGLGVAINFTAGALGALKSAWDKLPDFGKHKGLFETLHADPNRGILPQLMGSQRGAPFSQLGSGDTRPDTSGRFPGIHYNYPGGPDIPGGGPAAGATSPWGGALGLAVQLQPGRAAAVYTARQRNTWFDAMIGRLLGRANDPTALAGQISRYRAIAGLLNQRLAVTKDITRRLNLETQVADVMLQIRDRQQQIADKAAADLQARRDTQMGWLDFAIERAGATKTVADDRRALRAKEAFIKELIRHEGRTLDLVRQLWETRQQIRDLNKSKAGVDPLAGLMQVSSKQLANMLAAGTGLSAAGRARLAYNVAGAEIQPTHIHVHIDGREVAQAVTVHQTRAGRRTARQTSGSRD